MEYRIIKEKGYYSGTWYYIEYYHKGLFKIFDNWKRLREDAPVSVDMIYGVVSDDKQDVCFRSKKECKKYIKLL